MISMKPSLVAAVAFFIFLCTVATTSEAQVASFQGSTLGFSRNGDFNASGSTCPGGATPTAYQWTFVEDGVIRLGNPVSHRFTAPYGAFTVQLKVTCPDNSTATRLRPVCFTIGVGGCIHSDRGYN